MVTISIEFLAGQYHANPWGRNVNESVAEWPPSPYRLLRALFDTWKRKAPQIDEKVVSSMIEKLSIVLPVFELPDARTSSFGVYQNENLRKDRFKRQLIYDSFVVTDKGAVVKIRWDNVSLEEEEEEALRKILDKLGYLGRSESLVKAKIYDNLEDFSVNCFPAGTYMADEEGVEKSEVAVPIPKKEYENKSSKYYPWIDVIMMSTTELTGRNKGTQKRAFGSSPAMRFVTYERKIYSSHSEAEPLPLKFRSDVNAILFAIDTNIPPMVQDTIDIAERIHRKLIGIQKRMYGDVSTISEKFTGKDESGKLLKGHRHLFIIPLDTDKDERIDHVFIRAKEPFTLKELGVFSHLDTLWQPDGKPDIKMLPVEMGRDGKMSINEASTLFVSETPFIPPRHYRKGRGDYTEWLVSELKREARNHDLPEPVTVRTKDRLTRNGRSIRWLDFKRSRKEEPAMNGYGFEIEFQEQVRGPFTIGYASHYGLGLFVPVKRR